MTADEAFKLAIESKASEDLYKLNIKYKKILEQIDRNARLGLFGLDVAVHYRDRDSFNKLFFELLGYHPIKASWYDSYEDFDYTLIVTISWWK